LNTIKVAGISKRFSKELIFSNISFEANDGDLIGITGYNGSGKSTLLQIIAGYISPTNGSVEHLLNNKKISADTLYQYVSMATPYIELMEECTLTEIISFYSKFKKLTDSPQTITRILETSQLGFAFNKPVKFYSSGMKQRVKLILAMMSDVPFVFLDEPLSNLDKNGEEWFLNLLRQNKSNKIIFISSNRVKEETMLCNKLIDLEDFKKQS
jgi:ABC-type multidrug transport system ATPase subunit